MTIRAVQTGAACALLILCAAPALAQQGDPGQPDKLAGFSEQTTLGGSGDLPARLVEDDQEKIALITPVLLEPWFAFKGRVNESTGFKFGVNYVIYSMTH